MTIGDALFARLAIRGFGKLTAEIGAMQSRIASGVNDPRPSADPARAVELSALRDVRARLETRSAVARDSADRLALTDQALAGLSEDVRSLKQIALRAANDALSPEAYGALRTEAVTLRATLLATANSVDSAGRPLFSGTAPGPAFEQTAAGVVYRGDAANSVAALGDGLILPTGISGAQVFGEGDQSLFKLVDDLILGLTEPMLSARGQVTSKGQGRLDLVRGRADTAIEVTLTGPQGSARVMLDLRLEAPGSPVDAINAHTARTGISAVLDANGSSIRLSSNGPFSLSQLTGGPPDYPVLGLGNVDDSGAPAGPVVRLRPSRLTTEAVIAATDRMVDCMANSRAAAGSLGAAVDRQKDALTQQRLVVDQAVSGLGDLDVAATLTRLQSLLLSEQAAQQTYVKISSQSLFNYLR